MQLQTSLEPQHILAVFFREIQRLVPLDALSIATKPATCAWSSATVATIR
jgi:hypothetical protein